MTLSTTVLALQQRIAEVALENHRNPHSVHLLAVSKGQPASAIVAAFEAGLTEFGESYWQEAQAKIQALSQLPLTWHFIGRLQRNKIRAIATHFSWVHSVSSLAAAQALARHRPADGPRLQICLQVNLDAEVGKDGISPEDTAALAEGVQHLPTLQLRGLMALPAPLAGEEAQYRSLHRLATLAETLRETKGLCLDTLSMGMSEDWIAALRAGSTCIRLGRAIFGARCYTSRL